MMDSFNNVPSGIEIYHSLYKELTPHTMMNRLKAAQNMVNTSTTLDGKIDLRGPPTRFITKIRESMRQYKTLYNKRECLRESLVCDLLLLRLPRIYDGVVKRLGVKPPETELTLLMVQELLITQYEHQQVVEPKRPMMSVFATNNPKEPFKGSKEGLKKRPNQKLAQQSVQRTAASVAMKAKKCDNCGKVGHTWNSCYKRANDARKAGSQTKDGDAIKAMETTNKFQTHEPYGTDSASGPAGKVRFAKIKNSHAQGVIIDQDMNKMHRDWEFISPQHEYMSAKGFSAIMTEEWNNSEVSSECGSTDYSTADDQQAGIATQLANQVSKQMFMQSQKFEDTIAALQATLKKEYNMVPKLSLTQLQDIKNIFGDAMKPVVRRITLMEGTIKFFSTEHEKADKGFAVRIDAIKMQMDDIQAEQQKVLITNSELNKQVVYLTELAKTGMPEQPIWTDSKGKMSAYFSDENFKRTCLKCGKAGHMACNCYAKQHQRVPIFAAQKIKYKQCKSQQKQELQVDSSNNPSADAPETLWCTYCGERGHLIDECRTLRDQLFPWNRTSKRQVKENKSFARQLRFHKSKGDNTQPQDLFEGSDYDLVYENRVLPSIGSDTGPVSDVTEVGPTSSEEKISDIHYHTNVEFQQFKGYAYAVHNSGTHTTFIVDSGASQHLITNECYFDPTTINRSVRTNLQTAAGSFTLKEKGTARIEVQGTNGPFTLILENAWLHREGSHSLISVSQLDSKLGLLTNFGAIVITDQSGNSVIELIKKEGVYVLPEALACATLTSSLPQDNVPVAARSSMRISIPSQRMQEARVAHALSRSARTLTAPKTTPTRSTAVPLPARPSFAARRVTHATGGRAAADAAAATAANISAISTKEAPNTKK
jgi:hypothetical protein